MEAKYSGKCARCLTPFSVGADIYSDNKRWYVVNCRGCAKKGADLNSHLYKMAFPGPGTHDENYVEITCTCKFEAYCHDSWGLEWKVTLPLMPGYFNWSNDWTSGWNPSQSKKPFSCKGETLNGVISKTMAFISWYATQDQENIR